MASCWLTHMQLGIVQGMLIFCWHVWQLGHRPGLSYLLLHASPFPFSHMVLVLCSIVFVVLYFQTADPERRLSFPYCKIFSFVLSWRASGLLVNFPKTASFSIQHGICLLICSVQAAAGEAQIHACSLRAQLQLPEKIKPPLHGNPHPPDHPPFTVGSLK